MKDRELDRMVARVNPYPEPTVAELPTDGAEEDLLEEIMTVTTSPPRRNRRRLVLLVAAAVAALALAGGLLLPGAGPAGPAYAAEVIAVAEANQRLLLDSPDWQVADVNAFTTAAGEMRFTNGTSELMVHWRPAPHYRTYLTDRSAAGNTSVPIELLGQRGTMFRYRRTTDFTTLLPPKGPNFLEIRADVGSEQAYRALIAKLHAVDVNTWLDALPDSVVRPSERSAVVDEMLADVPVPPGFDRDELDEDTATNRYQVGARVSGAITCAWIDRWIEAKRTGDTAGLRAAVEALKSARSWKILQEIKDQGGFSEILWGIADSVVRGQPKPGYQQAIGCD